MIFKTTYIHTCTLQTLLTFKFLKFTNYTYTDTYKHIHSHIYYNYIMSTTPEYSTPTASSPITIDGESSECQTERPPAPQRTPPVRRRSTPPSITRGTPLSGDQMQTASDVAANLGDPTTPPPAPTTREPPMAPAPASPPLNANRVRNNSGSPPPPPPFDLDDSDESDSYIQADGSSTIAQNGSSVKTGDEEILQPSTSMPLSLTELSDASSLSSSTGIGPPRPSAAPPSQPFVAELTARQRKQNERKEARETKKKEKAARKTAYKRLEEAAKERRRLDKIEARKQKAQLKKEKASVKAKHQRLKLDRMGSANLSMLVNALAETLESLPSNTLLHHFKASLPIRMLDEHKLWSMKEEDPTALVRTLDDIFNYALGPIVKDHVPKCVWKVIPRRNHNGTQLNATQRNKQLQGKENDPLYMYFLALRRLGGQESDNDVQNRDDAAEYLESAVNELVNKHIMRSGNLSTSDKIWSQHFMGTGWCLAYHVLWTLMSLVTGDVEECRHSTYVDKHCGSTDQQRQYRHRTLETAEKVFHTYLRFTNRRAPLDTTDHPTSQEREEHHLVHFHMIRMFFQHVWPYVVGKYNDYPVVGTPDEVAALVKNMPIAKLFLFCQGKNDQTSLQFPVNMVRLALLFESNDYAPDVVDEISVSFLHRAIICLDSNYLLGLSSPYISNETLNLRQSPPGVLDLGTTKDDETIAAHERLWQLARRDFNDYMMHCGLQSEFIENTNSPAELHRKAVAKKLADKTATEKDRLDNIILATPEERIVSPTPLSPVRETNLDNASPTTIDVDTRSDEERQNIADNIIRMNNERIANRIITSAV